MKKYVLLALLLAAFIQGFCQFPINGMQNNGGTVFNGGLPVTVTGAGYVTGNPSSGSATSLFVHQEAVLTVNGIYDATINGLDDFKGPIGAAGTQTIAGTTAPTFKDITLNNGATQVFAITNTAGANVAGNMAFNNGITTTARTTPAAGALRFFDNAVYTTTPTDTRHVNGYVTKRGNDIFIYPVGSGTDVRTLEITAPANTAADISVAWILGNPSSTGDPSDAGAFHSVSNFASTLGGVSTVGQWDWIPTVAATNAVTVKVSIPDMTAFSSQANLRLAGWNGAQWIDLSGASTATGVGENSSLSGTIPAGGGSITAIGIAVVAASIPPTLTVSSPVCNGTTYSVSFSSNGTVTTSAGTISGSSVINIPVGTNATITATNGTATTVANITSPASCTNPPCVAPSLTVSQPVCNGTSTYNVAFSVTSGSTVTASTGTVSGNTITGVAVGTNVTLTATTAAGCTSTVAVTSPADCSSPCGKQAAGFSAGFCSGTTYSVNISNPAGATITASAGTVGATAITGIPLGTNVVITATITGCTAQTTTVNSPSKVAPTLTASSAVCNGTTYSVSFNSSGIVTASTGTVSGNTVAGIAVGTNVVLTATAINGCATTVATVNSPASCTTPCVNAPTLTAGQGVCNGTTTYNVAYSATAGATVTASTGVVTATAITGVAIGTNVTITATLGACTSVVVVNSPADCTTPCATPGASFSAGTCSGATYSVNITNPGGATITASTGTVTATAITNIALGTNVSITSAVTGCTAQTTTITSPSKVAPTLTTSSAVCNGATYSVSFNSNGVVTASTGVVSGSTVTGIAVGTNVVLTAKSANGCATTVATVNSPASCTTPCVNAPTLTAGQGVCNGTTTYNVAYSATSGATVTASTGVVTATAITGVAIGTNVTITATLGACTSVVVVNSPADCTTPCATPAASFSAGTCSGATYSVNISNPSGATITASTGTVGATAITNIALGTNVVITSTATGCAAQTTTITSPSKVAPTLTTSSAVCNGATYSVSFNSNGVVTASTGVVSGSTVTGIAVGTNVVLTAKSANGCATTVATVNSPASCTTPCVNAPTLTAGQGVCNGTTTYNVAYSATSGATVTASTGVVTATAITGVAIGTNVTITATLGACTSVVVVNSPADCTTPCATPAASFSAGTCSGATYSVNISNPSGATITASTGTVGATAITNIALGTNVVITSTAPGCAAQTTTITSPNPAAPMLSISSAVCNGTTYSVSFSSNGVVTASTGVVSGSTVTGIAVGTNVVLTAKSVNGCGTSTATANSPSSCVTPCTTAPTLTAGQGVCNGANYQVGFTVTSGATVTASTGTIAGNTITGIATGTNVTITATNGACSSVVIVNSPADCTTPCASPAASFAASECNGATYSVNITNPKGAVITASTGTVTATAITNIATGTNVTITATVAGCSVQTVVINSPTCSSSVPLTLKVFLEGDMASSGATMRNELQQYLAVNGVALLPTTDPYGNSTTYANINNPAGAAGAVADWVKVEVRSAASGYATVLQSMSLLLKTDGTIVTASGAVPVFNTQTGTVRIDIIHRNHLSIQSQNITSFSGAVSYDFSTGIAKAFNAGDPAQMKLRNGVYCMIAGDVNKDFAIDGTDASIFNNDFNAGTFDVYNVSDINMDGVVDGSDASYFNTNFNAGYFSTMINY